MPHVYQICFGALTRPLLFSTPDFGDFYCLFCSFDECNGIFLDTVGKDYYAGLNLRTENEVRVFSKLLESGRASVKVALSTTDDDGKDAEYELDYEIRTPIYGDFKGDPVFSFPAFDLEIPVRVGGFVAACLNRLADHWDGLMLGGNLLGSSDPLADPQD